MAMIFPTVSGRASAGAAVLLAAALALPLTACDGSDDGGQAAAAAPPPAVTVTPVVREPVTERVEFVGRVEATDHVDLRARVTGFLTERAFDEGDDVAAGDLLFLIEPDPYEAAVAQAQAALQRAQAAVPQTENALRRAQQLVQRGNISEAAVDDAVAAAAQAEADVAAAEAALRQAELNLSYTRITTPLAGRTSRATFSVGNLVGPDSGVLASVTSMDPIHVMFNLSERDLIEFRRNLREGGLQVGDVVLRLRLPDNSAYDHGGRINYTSPRIDPNTGTVPIRGVFPNPDSLLQPGLFVTVIASGSDPELVLTVPQSAVQQDQAGAFVLVVDENDTVQIRRVTTGRQEGASWVIQGGLDEGDLVIVQGLQRVRPGIVVNPTVQAPAAEG